MNHLLRVYTNLQNMIQKTKGKGRDSLQYQQLNTLSFHIREKTSLPKSQQFHCLEVHITTLWSLIKESRFEYKQPIALQELGEVQFDVHSIRELRDGLYRSLASILGSRHSCTFGVSFQ